MYSEITTVIERRDLSSEVVISYGKSINCLGSKCSISRAFTIASVISITKVQGGNFILPGFLLRYHLPVMILVSTFSKTSF